MLVVIEKGDKYGVGYVDVLGWYKDTVILLDKQSARKQKLAVVELVEKIKIKLLLQVV